MFHSTLRKFRTGSLRGNAVLCASVTVHGHTAPNDLRVRGHSMRCMHAARAFRAPREFSLGSHRERRRAPSLSKHFVFRKPKHVGIAGTSLPVSRRRSAAARTHDDGAAEPRLRRRRRRSPPTQLLAIRWIQLVQCLGWLPEVLHLAELLACLAQLLAHIAQILAHVAQLLAHIAELLARLAQLLARLAQLLAHIAQLLAHPGEHLGRLARRRRRRRRRRRLQFAPSAGLLAHQAVGVAACDTRNGRGATDDLHSLYGRRSQEEGLVHRMRALLPLPRLQ